MFTAPGLYEKEKKLVLTILVSSSILFYLGAAFAYFVVFPLIFSFFISIAPEGISVMTDISRYLDFVITLFFAFGFAFEVPVVTIILVMTNISTTKSLSEKRPYVIVGAFIVGMLLTPPDVISQTLLAIPIWILYEIGIFFSKIISRNKMENNESIVDDINSDNGGKGNKS
jgi:sec-independent protein translocase protein TatC